MRYRALIETWGARHVILQEGPCPIRPYWVCIFRWNLGFVSGTAAMSFRKGSPRHVLRELVFVASMLTMAVFAVYLPS